MEDASPPLINAPGWPVYNICRRRAHVSVEGGRGVQPASSSVSSPHIGIVFAAHGALSGGRVGGGDGEGAPPVHPSPFGGTRECVRRTGRNETMSRARNRRTAKDAIPNPPPLVAFCFVHSYHFLPRVAKLSLFFVERKKKLPERPLPASAVLDQGLLSGPHGTEAEGADEDEGRDPGGVRVQPCPVKGGVQEAKTPVDSLEGVWK